MHYHVFALYALVCMYEYNMYCIYKMLLYNFNKVLYLKKKRLVIQPPVDGDPARTFRFVLCWRRVEEETYKEVD